MIRHLQIQIDGRVSHHGFKLQTMIAARRMMVNGTVEEMPDKLIIDAEGEEKNVKGLVNWCKTGPIAAQLENMLVIEKPVAYFDDFTIL